jgi:prepilin-type N-terminal cleavage/methylation domain-containing protein
MKNILEKNPSFPGNKPRVWSRKGFSSQKGFTLIEIVITLVLAGIMAAVGGMGIVQAVKGYVITKQNSEITQKAQLAMSRITREIVEMIRVTSNATATALPLSTPTGEKIIGLNNGAVKIAFGSATLPDGDVLIDGVQNLTFTYYQGSTASATWAAGNDKALSGVKVILEIRHPDGQTLAFGGPLIYPRNNGNLGGEIVSGLTSDDVDSSWGDIRRCFVATAAYGDAGHPMVQILRDFRDQHLLKFKAGQWFVKQYYEYGPAMADMIRNRPVAMWAVRCLLAPVVALSFCLMYAPLAIIFVLLLSMIITSAAFSVFRRGFKLSPGVFSSRGSILMGLIVTMVLMAVLAAAMLPMFSSSYMNQIYSDQGRKAYFMAESGFTYAQYKFFEANSDADKEAVISDMNGKTYTFTNGNSFKHEIYPYWFKTQAASAGSTTLVTQSLGYIPTGLNSLPAGNIRVNYKYYSYTSTSSGSFIFNGISPALPATDAGLDVQFVALSNNGSGTVTNGGDITISSGFRAFPEFNGTFSFYPTPAGIPDGTVFRYERRTGSVLKNVTLADARKPWINFSVTNGTKVVLDKFLIVNSTGSVGNASREVTYYVPLGWMAGGVFKKVEHLDKDMTHFFSASNNTIGTHTVSGGKMAVSSVVDPYAIRAGGFVGWVAGIAKALLKALGLLPEQGMWGIVGYDWSDTNVNLAQSWMDTQGGLSYDIQVKMHNTDPYFMTGIGFKLRSNDNESDAYGYGVSMMRQRERRKQCWNLFTGWEWASFSSWSQNDGIHPDLRPLTAYGGDYDYGSSFLDIDFGSLTCRYAYRYADPAIVLWQRNGPASSTGNFKLLAYRIVQATDGLTSGTGTSFRLNPWVTIMVRVIEGYELPFSAGRVDSFGRHIKYGDTIMNQAGTKSARVVGTPVMSSVWGASGSSTGIGKMMLTNVIGGGFSSGEHLYIVGGDGSAYATTSAAQSASKANYILVYYSDVVSGSGDTVQANNTRRGNPVYTTQTNANWPPDDWTDRAAANDYFTLVKWHYITPGSNQVSASGSWTLGNGWSASGSNLNRVESFGPYTYLPVNTGWTFAGGDWDYSGGVRHRYAGLFDNNWGKYAQYNSFIPTSGVSYQSSISVSGRNGLGSARYYIGDATINISGSSPYVVDFNGSSQVPKFECTGWWGGTITEWKIRPRVTPGTATIPLINPLTAGTSFTISFTVSGLDSGESITYAIGGYGATITSNGAHSAIYTLPWDASSAGNVVFSSSSGVTHQFSITSLSVIPALINGTLNTTADSQGNVASYVPAHGSTDFYQAVVKTGALVSPAWSSSATYQTFLDGGGDSIALVTSSSAPNAGATTFYDDFAVQLDMKAGVGFMPPIQR